MSYDQGRADAERRVAELEAALERKDRQLSYAHTERQKEKVERDGARAERDRLRERLAELETRLLKQRNLTNEWIERFQAATATTPEQATYPVLTPEQLQKVAEIPRKAPRRRPADTDPAQEEGR